MRRLRTVPRRSRERTAEGLGLSPKTVPERDAPGGILGQTVPHSCGPRANAILRGCGVSSQDVGAERRGLGLRPIKTLSRVSKESGAPRAVPNSTPACCACPPFSPLASPSKFVLQSRVFLGSLRWRRKPENADSIAPTSAVFSPVSPPRHQTNFLDDDDGVESRQSWCQNSGEESTTNECCLWVGRPVFDGRVVAGRLTVLQEGIKSLVRPDRKKPLVRCPWQVVSFFLPDDQSRIHTLESLASESPEPYPLIFPFWPLDSI